MKDIDISIGDKVGWYENDKLKLATIVKTVDDDYDGAYSIYDIEGNFVKEIYDETMLYEMMLESDNSLWFISEKDIKSQSIFKI